MSKIKNLYKGDCLTELKKLADCSIDSIVTDPPYELTSGRPPVGFDHCLRGVFLEVQLPQLTNAVAKAPKFSKFDRELLDVVGLRRVVFGIDPRVGVPVGSVDFESNPVFEHEINNADVAAAITTDPDLSLITDTKTVKNSGNFVLQLRDTGHSPFCQGSCGCVRQLAPGLLGVPVVIGGYALCDAFGLSAPSTDPSSLSDGIGCGDDSLGEASGTAFVVASPGAELGAVLAFDVARGAFDLFTADGAMKGDEPFELLRPQLVGTLSGTSGLPTVFETTGVSQVVDPANWALSFDHLVLPAQVLSFLGDNRSRGGFMGKTWDATGIAYNVEMWRECLRVLKPGGHLLAFSGSRTYHRMTVAIEDAGFEIRDQIMWIYGSGFPKSLDVSKAIDKAAGANGTTDQIIRMAQGNARKTSDGSLAHLTKPMKAHDNAEKELVDTPIYAYAPATFEAQRWQGWGTALKPAHEPICVARKPLTGTVASNVLKWGTGALNIDGTRVGYANGEVNFDRVQRQQHSEGAVEGAFGASALIGKEISTYKAEGRWPSNVIHDGSEEVLAGFPTSKSGTAVKRNGVTSNGVTGWGKALVGTPDVGYSDAGSAARFFYCAKASKSERNAGLEGLPTKTAGEATDRQDGTAGLNPPRAGAGRTGGTQNFHPTVKPLALMRYLIKLVTPPGGTVLDPFLGSGSTAVAAILEGFDWVGCEMTEDYWPIIEARVEWAHNQPKTLL